MADASESGDEFDRMSRDEFDRISRDDSDHMNREESAEESANGSNDNSDNGSDEGSNDNSDDGSDGRSDHMNRDQGDHKSREEQRSLQEQLSEARERIATTTERHRAEIARINAARDTERARIIEEKDRIIADKQAMIDEGIEVHGDWRARKVEKELTMRWHEEVDDLAQNGQMVSPRNPAHIRAGRRCAKKSNYSPKRVRPGLRFRGASAAILEVHDELRSSLDPQKNFVPGFPFRLMELFFRTPGDDRERLPLKYLCQILCEELVKPCGIDVLSRFDPFASYPFNDPVDPVTRLPPRLSWAGNKAVSINEAPAPNDVLAVLLVSRLWLELGANIFYGMNLFKFSSFGELGRFLIGIGPARRARIQKIELTWIGSLMYKTEVPKAVDTNSDAGAADDAADDAPVRKSVCTSARTLPLLQLSKLINLKSVKIHIDETRPQRNKEIRSRRQILGNGTTKQLKDFRKRALPTLQGIPEFRDLVRGLTRLEFYDYTSKSQKKKRIQDKVFLNEVRSLVTRRRAPEDIESARAENLPPILPWRFARWEERAIIDVLENILEWIPGVDDQDSDDDGDEGDVEGDDGDDEDGQEDEDDQEDEDGQENGDGQEDGDSIDGCRRDDGSSLNDVGIDPSMDDQDDEDNDMFFPENPSRSSQTRDFTPELQSDISETPLRSPLRMDDSDDYPEVQHSIMSSHGVALEHPTPITPASAAIPDSESRSKRIFSESPGGRLGGSKRQRIVGENLGSDQEDEEESAKNEVSPMVEYLADEGYLADEEDSAGENVTDDEVAIEEIEDIVELDDSADEDGDDAMKDVID